MKFRDECTSREVCTSNVAHFYETSLVLAYFEGVIPSHELKNDEYWSTEEFRTLKLGRRVMWDLHCIYIVGYLVVLNLD